MNNLNKWLLLFLCMAIYSCEKEPALPQPSSFDKKSREKLGDILKEAILADTEVYPFLPNVAPYDTTVYWYLQKLYDQVTNSIRIDNHSPKADRWNPNRSWNVRVLNIDTDKIAFALPGGHFYISTGLLKTLRMEHELYYIFAFEAVLVENRFILNRLISEYNSQFIYDLIQGNPTQKDIELVDIARAFLDLKYEKEVVAQADVHAANLICKSSIYDRLGLLSVLGLLNKSDHWLRTRPSYSGRTIKDLIQGLPMEKGNECGMLKTNGGYQRYVWDPLN